MKGGEGFASDYDVAPREQRRSGVCKKEKEKRLCGVEMSLSPPPLFLPLFSRVRKYNNNPFSPRERERASAAGAGADPRELGSLWAAPTKKGPSTLVCVNGIPFRLRRSVKGFLAFFDPGLTMSFLALAKAEGGGGGHTASSFFRVEGG